MNFKKKLFTVFVILGAIVFILGRIRSPFLFADRSFNQGIDMRYKLRDLRNLVETSLKTDAPEYIMIDNKIGEVERDLEVILDDARKRHYSKWPTDTLAASIVVVGFISTLIVSWRSDTKRKKVN